MATEFKYKEELRTALYLVAAMFIVYFFYDTYQICHNMSNYELLIKQPENLSFDTKTSIDYRNTFGGQVWNVAMNIIQIIFLVAFMLLLNFHEILEKWRLRN